MTDHRRLYRLLWLSVAAAVLTISLKTVAWLLTGSVGLLSDAAESVVNLVAAIVAILALRWAAKPADDEHAHGHHKAEYFSAGVEGALILVAAVSIGVTAVLRLFDPQPLEDVGVGIVVSVVASLINLAVGRALMEAGRRERSLILEADGRHLITDVVTSAGVVLGVALVAVTGYDRLDAAVALAVAVNILVAGSGLLRRSVDGLMDRAIPEDDLGRVRGILETFTADRGIEFHALRTRQAGPRAFVSVHVLVPGAWSVQRGHDLTEEIEHAVLAALPQATVLTHLEPQEDPASFADQALDRVPVG